MKTKLTETELRKLVFDTRNQPRKAIELGDRFMADGREWVAIKALPDGACYAVWANKVDLLPEEWDDRNSSFRKHYIRIYDPFKVSVGTRDPFKALDAILQYIKDMFPDGVEIIPDKDEEENLSE